MSGNHYSGILLAAGNSSRMNKWKIEIEIQNVPLLFHSLQKLKTVCDEVIVVGGCNFDKLVELIERTKLVETENIKVICNQQYQAGMFSSIKTGMKNSQYENVFIALADMPFISIETYGLLKTKFEFEKQYDFIQPAMLLENGRRKKGHPILINEKVKAAINKERDTTTLRDVLKVFSGNSFLCEDLGINYDIDTEADLLNAEKIFY
ncbi:MAG: nucleotidyltransferase family protein [Ignavibacteriaceae bacterium]|nr:nucleotidyltransferase family protein [Ignavibacteriaceae bacterium]